jgi:hypothetical protein
MHPDEIELSTTATDIERIVREKNPGWEFLRVIREVTGI